MSARKQRHLLAVGYAALAVATAGGLVFVGAGGIAGARADTSAIPEGSFGWPVKPFYRQHPVRANFGDPRTIFSSPPTIPGLLKGHVHFQFHHGVDISAPRGTAVYAVQSGVVKAVANTHLTVTADAGRSFTYFHITPRVRAGQPVLVNKTVLGVITAAAHVDLAVSRDGVPVNPLARGQIAPYTDRTRPSVDAILLRQNGQDVFPNFVRGRVSLLVRAHDLPALPVAGEWADLPVTPAVLSWRIQRCSGKVVVPAQVTWDVRTTLPPPGDFWRVYARGTYQNMAVFGPHYSYMMGGSYLFKLGRTAFDTHRLRDGIYDLVVTATDTRGNGQTRTLRFLVHNRAGWTGNGS